MVYEITVFGRRYEYWYDPTSRMWAYAYAPEDNLPDETHYTHSRDMACALIGVDAAGKLGC